MVRSRRLPVILFVVLLVCAQTSQCLAQSTGQEKKKPAIIEGKTFLPLRVLPRLRSHVYKEPDESKGIVQENVPVFQPYFVYTRPKPDITGTKAQGWYEVGTDNRGGTVGWMKAEDVMEWKQTMCLSYTHPGGRHPVLLYGDLKALQEVVRTPAEERKKAAEECYRKIESKDIPPDFPIISIEPKDAIDITEKFYLLPILEHASVDIDGREARYLKLAAATQSGRGEVSLSNPEGGTSNPGGGTATGNPEGGSANPEQDREVLKNLEIDIVYVVDMTASMGPYIKATTEVIKNISLLLTQNTEIANNVRFGLWGYRDSTTIPGLEFTTKNFTPTLQDVNAFGNTLAAVEVARVGSGDYPEDVFSGIDKAMRETQWTESALHFIVLLGDAPSHELKHQWNHSEQNETTLRSFADDHKFYLFALHIKDPGGANTWELAEKQFRVLSRNKGEAKDCYHSVQSMNREQFAQASKTIAESFIEIENLALQGKMPHLAATGSPGASTSASSGALPSSAAGTASAKPDDVRAKVMSMGYAAVQEWLGSRKGVEAPRDIIAWVIDKDLMDPSIQALDVRVLVNKKEIDALTKTLQEIMYAGRKGIIGGGNFFTALQSIPSVMSRAGDQVKNAKSLAESGLIPEFMDGLPYNSRIMNMSNDLWGSWSQEQQEEFLDEVDAKIKLYAAIHDTPKGWIALNKGDDPDEHVYPVSLEMLP